MAHDPQQLPKPAETPCVPLSGVPYANSPVLVKLESLNFTGSHKDRESRAIIAHAKTSGATALGCASTGNAAISLSAHAKLWGLHCHVWVTRQITAERRAQIELWEPEIHYVDGAYDRAITQSNLEMASMGIYNANPGTCDARIEGDADLGLEIARQLSVTVVICPMNNGTLACGIQRGLARAGHSARIIGAAMPHTKFAKSIDGFHRHEQEKLDPLKVKGLIQSIVVNDREVKSAMQFLMRAGLLVEPAAAAAIAALRHVSTVSTDVVCCVLTGNGLKFPAEVHAAAHAGDISVE